MASAVLLVLGVSLLASYRYGGKIGLLAGAVQATTAWTVLRGRLAEADILLACLMTWTLLAFDRLRCSAIADDHDRERVNTSPHWRWWQWAFFGLLSLTSLVKGTGFGAVLALSVVITVTLWDRDRTTRQRLLLPAGWILVVFMVLAWPLAMVAKHGWKVIGLWLMHVTERVGPQTSHGPFAGESWPVYGLNLLGQALPWTPLALIGAWWSLSRTLRDYRSSRQAIESQPRELAMGDRLLWAWALMPLLLVSLISARKAQYAIYAMVPWSIWSALGLDRLKGRLIARGWSALKLRHLIIGGLTGLATVYGLCFWLAGPWLNHRGTEWAFYERVSRQVLSGESLILLYDDWDRDPYPTPFGPIPHDLAIRLYYLNLPACWHFEAGTLANHLAGECSQRSEAVSTSSLLVLGRARDLPALEQLGPVEILSQGVGVRWDRTYLLARIWPGLETAGRTALETQTVTAIRPDGKVFSSGLY